FTSANLENSDLSRAFLHGAILKNANLINSNLLQAELAYADLSNSNLSNANLKQTDLIFADFSNANISGANLLLSYSKNAKFNNVIITDDTKTDSCFKKGFLDRVMCQGIRNLNSDSPPFYGEMRGYHRDDVL
ncbi:MAG TPA: pentapeptide repeat-containing protein, partial [Candidatus Nitrosopelagicus sp.]|nr:pentapeptide repeat-containing protein [Candidatus Nitrosopelagicus sp.]